MSRIRPGGLSDYEDSDEDQLIECDETGGKQFCDRNNATATSRNVVRNNINWLE